MLCHSSPTPPTSINQHNHTDSDLLTLLRASQLLVAHNFNLPSLSDNTKEVGAAQ